MVSPRYTRPALNADKPSAPLDPYIPTWSTTSSNNHLSFSLSHIHVVWTWIYRGRTRDCQIDVSHLCWLSLVVDTTWFGRFSNIAHRYRKPISIIETYSIDFFSCPLNCHKLTNNVPYLTECPSWEWLQRRVSDNRYDDDPMHFWAVMGCDMQ